MRFRRALDQCCKLYGGRKQDFAAAIGVTPPIYSRLRNGSFEPSLVLLLRMADVCRYPPDTLLRAGGYGHIIPLLHRLYGPLAQSAHRLTPAERLFIDKWRRLKPAEQRAFAVIIHSLAKARHVRRRQTRAVRRATPAVAA